MKPSKRRDEAYLGDIKTSCSTIADRLRHRHLPDLAENGEFRDGILMQLIIIGEEANQITEKTRRLYPGVLWKEIAGLRHVLVHAYWTYDLLQIWNTATKEVPELLSMLE